MIKGRSSDYFERRAEEERIAAAGAANPKAARSHRELAHRYTRLAKEGPPPPLDDEAPTGVLFKDFGILR